MNTEKAFIRARFLVFGDIIFTTLTILTGWFFRLYPIRCIKLNIPGPGKRSIVICSLHYTYYKFNAGNSRLDNDSLPKRKRSDNTLCFLYSYGLFFNVLFHMDCEWI